MPKYRKKPVIINAFQLTWEVIVTKTLPDWIIGSKNIKILFNEKIKNSQYAIIDTIDGRMQANANDWIIQGVIGEIYPCKNEVFEKTYELA